MVVDVKLVGSVLIKCSVVDVTFICVVLGCKLVVVVWIGVVVEHELERIVIVLSNCVFNVSKSVFNDCIVSMTDCSVKVALLIISRTSCTNFTSSYVLYRIVSQSK